MLKTTKANMDYISKGVSISPAVPSMGEKLHVIYDGLLSKSGASHIYVRIGYGSKWDDFSDFKMNKTSTGFDVSVPILKTDTLNVCFKDCANNWDNNSGKNYTFDVL